MMRFESSTLGSGLSDPEPAHLEFAFPAPSEGGAFREPPRAILSLRAAGSMRYLAGTWNPRRAGFFDSLGIEAGRVVATELHHTRRVRIIDTHSLGEFPRGEVELDARGLPGEEVGDGGPDAVEGCDGMVFLPPSAVPATPSPPAAPRPVATVTVADCMPIWLWDSASGAWGLLHSGWKGTGILERAIQAISARRGVSPATMSVILGPAIGACCYEVPETRAEFFAAEFGEHSVDRSGPRPRIDIRAANLAIARRLGVGALLSIDACTSCDSSLGSFRREGASDFTRMVAACVPV
ncbi:MAG TPA: polyphenol oxidase family protein [Rectinemataceae bacterium]|nr:polyphenol oxidase family protein [Rectinemataceae bacterium]